MSTLTSDFAGFLRGKVADFNVISARLILVVSCGYSGCSDNFATATAIFLKSN